MAAAGPENVSNRVVRAHFLVVLFVILNNIYLKKQFNTVIRREWELMCAHFGEQRRKWFGEFVSISTNERLIRARAEIGIAF